MTINALIIGVIALGLWKAYEIAVKGIARFEKFQNDRINTNALDYKRLGELK